MIDDVGSPSSFSMNERRDDLCEEARGVTFASCVERARSLRNPPQSVAHRRVCIARASSLRRARIFFSTSRLEIDYSEGTSARRDSNFSY